MHGPKPRLINLIEFASVALIAYTLHRWFSFLYETCLVIFIVYFALYIGAAIFLHIMGIKSIKLTLTPVHILYIILMIFFAAIPLLSSYM